MLKPYNLEYKWLNSADYVHLLTETMRRAFADRDYFLGDPDFVEIPREELMSKSYNKHTIQGLFIL